MGRPSFDGAPFRGAREHFYDIEYEPQIYESEVQTLLTDSKIVLILQVMHDVIRKQPLISLSA